jgi:putative membrane protein
MTLGGVAAAQSGTSTPAPSAGGQTTPRGPAPTTRAQATTGERRTPAPATTAFLKEAADGGMAEVELAQLAQQKASSQQVKDLAKKIESDHTSANTELKSLAQSKSVTLPADISAAHKATKARLSKLAGASFDKAYTAEMVKDHQKDIAAFKKQQASTDADVKQFVTKTLPTLEQHLQMAQAIK